MACSVAARSRSDESQFDPGNRCSRTLVALTGATASRDVRSTAVIFYPTEKIALFIDGSNLYATAKSLGFEIDYKRLLTTLRGKGHLIRASYYTAVATDNDYSSIRPLLDWLEYNGYSMVTKATKEYTDASGRRKTKGNMDIELAVDALRLATHLDHVVLFTGDGDFRCLIAALQQLGVRVTVVSTLRTQPPMVSDDLRRQADQSVDLADIEDDICRDTAGHIQRASSDQRV